MNNLKEKLTWLEQNTNHDVVYLALQGSQNYGLDVYTDEYMSDIDVKAIIIPSLDDIIKGKKMFSRTYIMQDNSHVDVKDIRLYVDLWKKANPTFLEILFTKYYIVKDEFKDSILTMNHEISEMNKNKLLSCCKGMAHEKRKTLCHPYPTIEDKIDKYGYDPKQLHHIYRMLYLMFDYFLNDETFENALSVPNEERHNALLRFKTEPVSCESAIFMADSAIDLIKEISSQIRKTIKFEFNKETYDLLQNKVNKLIKDKIIQEVSRC